MFCVVILSLIEKNSAGDKCKNRNKREKNQGMVFKHCSLERPSEFYWLSELS